MRRTRTATVYLLGALPTAVASVLAFPLLSLPAVRRRWAVLHLRRAAALRGGVPADLDVGELGAVPAAVEAVAYFTVTEALTNVAKHSGARRAAVRVGRAGDRLLVEVRDDGGGGASEDGGTGLAGIRRRAEALDGRLTVTSPRGGPTVIVVELPCRS